MLWMNFKMAMNSLRASKARSLLTMLGIIIGVASVVSVVSIGEGVKNQVVGEIDRLGRDLINVSPGDSVVRNEEGEVTDINLFSSIGTSTLTEEDLEIVASNTNVSIAVPMTYLNGSVSIDNKKVEESSIVATSPDLPAVLNQDLEVGSFLSDEIVNRRSVVVGYDIAQERLGGTDRALGRKIKIKGQEFTIIGVMKPYESTLLGILDLNKATFIPFDTGKEFNGGFPVISEINARIIDLGKIDQTVSEVTQSIIVSHDGEEDFSVIKQEEVLKIADTILSLLTTLVAAIAAISLVVGGIGVMNIMLVAVTERTHEIGIRKSIGAMNSQIMSQFLIESVMISVIGGVIGVIVSIFTSVMIGVYTDIEPAITIPIILIATLVSTLVGVIFGTFPAFKAARKNPIDALRHT